jgi:hypothetical protein
MLFPGSIIPTHDDRTIFVRVCTKVVERRGGGGTATHFQRVVAVDVGTGRQREVVAVPSPQSFESLAMTPDGRTLAAVVVDNRDEGDSRRRLVRFGMDGSNYRELYVTPTAQGRMDDLSWALGGSEIRWCEASSPTERCQYMKIDAGGGTPEVLPGLLSPDGSHAITVPRATATSSELWAIDSFLPKTAR